MSQVTLSGSSGEDDESPWLGGRLPNGAEPAPVLGRGFLELHHWFQPGPNAPLACGTVGVVRGSGC